MTKTWMLAGVAASALIATPALAQTDASAAAVDAPAEIVVTAQKRTERLQDVPVAVSVISGDAIAARGAVTIENAQYLVPTLNFRKSGAAINQSLFLRGVGTSTFSIAGEPSVSTVVDGVVYSRAGEAFSDLVDIERIEVLRGPQGTLFGKNASAGVVNIVTKDPGNTLSAALEASWFEGNEWRGRATVSIPFGDDAGLRVTGFYGKYDGNIFNVASNVNRYVNGYERYGVRAKLVAEVVPNLRATVIADWRRANDECCAEVIGTAPGTINLSATIGGVPNTVYATIPAATVQTALVGTQFERAGSRRIRQNRVTESRQESYGGSLQLDLDAGGVTVTSITALRRFDESEIRDGDFIDQAYAGIVQLHDVGPQTGKTFTQELRLTSNGRNFIDYVVGGFYSAADTRRMFTRNDIVCNPPVPTTLPVTPIIYSTLVPCGTAGAPPSTFPNGTADFGSIFKNLAFFGQATLNLDDNIRLIGGLRYTSDQLDVDLVRRTGLAGPGISGNFDAGVYNGGATTTNPTTGVVTFLAGPSNGIPFTNKTTNTNWSGKGGAQFDISRNHTIYATYSRGYKGPAFNVFFNLASNGAAPIAPETSDAYEIGLKNTLFGGRLVLNLAAYYAKYNNFQANNPDIIAGVVVTRFTNAGEISTRGGELDFVFRPFADLSLSGGLAYTDARVDAFRVVPGQVSVPNGTRLAYAPEWKGSLAIDYRLRTNSGFDFAFGAQGSFQSSQISQFDVNAAVRAATTIGAYSLVDLSAGVLSSDDRFRLTFQVKNVFDKSFASAITSGGPGGSFRYIIPREADRYFGVTAAVKFGN
ncbi:MAG: TonB-dependent receptor [Sphingomonadaceae bacterium]